MNQVTRVYLGQGVVPESSGVDIQGEGAYATPVMKIQNFWYLL